MKCYKCNTVISSPDENICHQCGADLRVYKKIIYTSNYYYNQGLEKAKIRDLTGAVRLLQNAVQLNKRNIDARNLLGLIYLEMGEAALAVGEWTNSKSIQLRDNKGETYLRNLQKDEQTLESLNQGIQKYNLALKNAKNGGVELAEVQLRKAIQVNPKLLKAYQLLALLYMKEKKLPKAKAALGKCLRMDKGNIRTLVYLEEISDLSKKNKAESDSIKETEDKKIEQAVPLDKKQERQKDEGNAANTDLSFKDPVIIPKRKKRYGYVQAAIGLILGAATALGILYCMVLPHKEKQYEQQNQEKLSAYDQSVQGYSVQLADKDSTIQNLQQSISDLQAQNTELSNNTGNSAQLQMDSYKNLLETAQAYFVGDWITVYEKFPKIDSNAVSDTEYQATYNALRTAYNNTLGQNLVEQGNKRMEQRLNEVAIQCYVAAIKVNPGLPEAYYGVAWGYEPIDLNTTRVYYNNVITMFPGTDWAQKAQERLNAL